MSVQLDALIAQVKANTDLEASAIVLINGLATKLQQEIDALNTAGADTAKLQELSDQLMASAGPLSAAITANTPAAPTTPAQ